MFHESTQKFLRALLSEPRLQLLFPFTSNVSIKQCYHLENFVSFHLDSLPFTTSITEYDTGEICQEFFGL